MFYHSLKLNQKGGVKPALIKKYKKMEFVSFEKEYPKEFTSLLVKQENGDIVRGYYVVWSNTVYLALGSKKSQATGWKYFN